MVGVHAVPLPMRQVQPDRHKQMSMVSHSLLAQVGSGAGEGQ